MDDKENENESDRTSRLSDRVKTLARRLEDFGDELLRMTESKTDLEVRLKMIESETEKALDTTSDLDRRLRIFELNHDNRKERWNTAINFVIQLAWVAMAAFLLNKLGLQAPL